MRRTHLRGFIFKSHPPYFSGVTVSLFVTNSVGEMLKYFSVNGK